MFSRIMLHCDYNFLGVGDDIFDVLRNKCILDLNGESGDDSFVVQLFVMAVAYDGSLEDPSLG